MRGVRCAVVNYVLVATVGHIEYSIYVCQFQTISVFLFVVGLQFLLLLY